MHSRGGEVEKNTRGGQGMPGYHPRFFHFSQKNVFCFFFINSARHLQTVTRATTQPVNGVHRDGDTPAQVTAVLSPSTSYSSG